MIREVMILDVSTFQCSQDGKRHMDWQKAKPLVDLAILRAGIGTTVDREFAYNRAACEDLGIPWQAYHFYKAARDAKKQAELFARLTAKVEHGGPVTEGGKYVYAGVRVLWGDWEGPTRDFWVTKNMLGNESEKFWKRMGEYSTGELGVYTRATWWDPNMPLTNWAWRCPLWVAHWGTCNPAVPKEWANHGKTWLFHQYSADGNNLGAYYGSGGEDDIDLSTYNGTLAEFSRVFGVSVQPPPPPPPMPQLPALPWPAVVVVPRLNIRSGPGAGCDDLGDLLPGARPLVQALHLDGDDLWARIGDNLWCAMRYQGKQYMEWVK